MKRQQWTFAVMLVAIHILPVVLLHLLAATLGMKIVRLTKVLTVGSALPNLFFSNDLLFQMAVCFHVIDYHQYYQY